MTKIQIAGKIYTFKNKLEMDYALYLEAQRQAGEILEWNYERVRLKIADQSIGKKAIFYCPDFDVITKGNKVEMHETKGRERVGGMIKYRVAKEMFWELFEFKFIKRGKGETWIVKT